MTTLRAYLMRLVLFLMIATCGWGLWENWQNPPAWLLAMIKHATEKPAAWPNDYATGLAQAKAEHKPILLSFTGSDWCAYCQELDKNVLDTPTFRDFAAQNLVFVEVDLPQYHSQPEALKAQNMGLAMKYNVHAFPTLILLSSDEKILGKMEGYEDSGPKLYIAQLESFMKNDRSK